MNSNRFLPLAVVLLLVLDRAGSGGQRGTPPPAPAAEAAENSLVDLEKQFRELPMEARRLTGPLFWLHGDESPERLREILTKVVEGGNGCFCAESRPHSDWLGSRWFDDLEICLLFAKEHDLNMWIFDERWWPSQTLAGKVPEEYRARRLRSSATAVKGPRRLEASGFGGERLVAALAGRDTGAGIDGDSLVDLAPHIENGRLSFDVPAGSWRVMKFSWNTAPPARQGGHHTVDGASPECVEWFLRTVYEPHFDRFGGDHGDTVVGYFYDEPETQGDWGTGLRAVLDERGIDWKKAVVAWQFGLAGESQVAARYAYIDALLETWGRTMYGGMSGWCAERGVTSIGHFMEHDGLYLDHGLGAGNLMQMQKFGAMGGMDLVCRQLYPGERRSLYQVPKLTSSISHVYDKPDHLAMCEIFGAYGQDLTYEQMKWLADHHQVRGVNFMITHSFNPRAPHDTDCPPYFYNGGHEPRWPLYRVWADYTNRLSLMLTGGRHVCPVAFLFCGNSKHVGRVITPEDMTSALQDALYDCDWLPYEVFENDAVLAGQELLLHDERYRVLIVPPVEVVPYETFRKVHGFFDAGGVVVGYGFLPTASATLGRSAADIAAVREAVWGSPQPGLEVCQTNEAGGRSYFLPTEPTPEDLQRVLAGDAGIHPTLELLDGETDHWLHVLHRRKAGADVFLVCNQDHQGAARSFVLLADAAGRPERWDAMRNEIAVLPHRPAGPDRIAFELTLEPLESALVVFQKGDDQPPPRSRPGNHIELARINIDRALSPADPPAEQEEDLPLDSCPWVWLPDGDPQRGVPPGTVRFRAELDVGAEDAIATARMRITADNEFVLLVNGEEAGRGHGGYEGWRFPVAIDFGALLRPGKNDLEITVTNLGDGNNPAGLIGRYRVDLAGGQVIEGKIDTSWQAADDDNWGKAVEVARYGDDPWGQPGAGGLPTSSPIRGDPFVGRCRLPANLEIEGRRVYLELSGLPGNAASIQVNGTFAGGFIGKPWRLDVTSHVRTGENDIVIEPLAPQKAWLVVAAEVE